MATFTSASSSQVPSRKEYEVFISFRGSDVRFGFLGHLTNKLREKSIDVYVDDKLERGEEISSALIEAIEGSMIALVIFSKDYASSKWCLEELVKIMECKEAKQQIVIPIFYHIDPSDVRHQKNTYKEAFTHHKQKFNDNMEKLQIWRSVLKKTANLSGYHSSNFQDEFNLINAIVGCVLEKLEENNSIDLTSGYHSSNFQDESELINAIVGCVLKNLETNSPIDPRPQLIGFHQNFFSVESLMEVESLEEVQVLGIWGPRGIGKTTLARAIFDKFLSKFESHVFLENMREESTTVGGLSSLHQKLLSKLLDQNDRVDVNHALRRLKQKKVLIVLDDVDNPNQLKDLAGQQLYLGQGSRVIATSRDKHILRSGGIHEIYIHEVKELSLQESLELFSMHAFNQNHPIKGYEELSNLTVALAKGIPLALEFLGSHFHSRDEAYWESELSKLQKYPHQDIQNIFFKVVYDGLDLMEKEIFLDIAFFFLGVKKAEVIFVQEACHLGAISRIQNLIDKALIKLNGYDQIVMHDLIREMAEQIVHEEYIEHPERRSRLNNANEICDVLKSNMGTDEIEGIILDTNRIENLQLSADTFMNVRNLRILKIRDYSMGKPNTHIELPHGLNYLPDELKYFYWDYCPLKSLPLGSYLENLVELDMPNSNVEKLWDGKQDLWRLKKIDFSGSRQLRELADFSMAHKLEVVSLCECENLRIIHPSILSLHTIVEVWVPYCSKLESVESETHLESLTLFWARGCHNLKKFSLSSKKLRELCLDDGHKLEIFHLPNSHCTELRKLYVQGEGLRGLPIDELRCLTNLEVFSVYNFKQAIHTMELHSLFDAWRNLTELYLEGWSYLSEIPDNIRHLSNLKRFFVTECKRLKSILGLPPMLLVLDASECTSLETVSSDSLVLRRCDFYFHNCVKLDERSLGFIEELTHSSLTSLTSPSNEDFHYYATTCYPGSRVPKWMEYRPMTEDSNAIEFTCNLERSHDILFCCVAPGYAVSKGFFCGVCCECYWGDNNKYRTDYHDLYCTSHSHELNQDHVFLWYIHGGLSAAKISCEFFAKFLDEDFFYVPAKACGVHVIYH